MEAQKSLRFKVAARLPEKLRGLCDTARNAGYEFVWADTCCIDSQNMDEVFDAKMYMYAWYREAEECYVYLHDVPDPSKHPEDQHATFFRSVWWSRGWTLPELLAPPSVTFLSSTWTVVGTRQEFAGQIEKITSIDRNVLISPRLSLEAISAAKRMSWAASRRTRVTEDAAYCLAGIFGVIMRPRPTEGRNAFLRLQELILSKERSDQTLFAWAAVTRCPIRGLPLGEYALADESKWSPSLASGPSFPRHLKQYLLAASTQPFSRSSEYRRIDPGAFARKLQLSQGDLTQSYKVVSGGIQCTLPLVDANALAGEDSTPSALQVALLACENAEGQTLALLLHPGDHDKASGHDK